jgi:prepilin-type N-terminal cleavage/methylation domain-containing protein
LKRGFTLIEVVISLAILGIGLMVIIELFSGGLRLGRFSEENTRALRYASLKLEEITIQKTLEEGEEEGEFDPNFRWKVGVRKMDLLPVEKEADFKRPVELYHIRIEVIWNSGTKERVTSLESYKTVKSETDEKS